MGLFFLLWLVLYITKGSFLKGPFVNIASRQMERTVKVGGEFQLYLNPHVRFLAEDISIANPPWAKDDALFEARRVSAELSLWHLLVGKRRFRHLELDHADIALERNKEGEATWVFDKDKRKEPFTMPDIQRAQVEGTTVSYADPVANLAMGLRIGDVAMQRSKIGAPLSASGTGVSRGLPFRISATLRSPDEVLAGGRQKFAMTIHVGRSRVELAGDVRGATDLDGVDLAVEAEGENLSRPFQLMGIVVPETRNYAIRGIARKEGDTWRLRNLKGRFGQSDLAGSLAVHTGGEKLKLEADLMSRRLHIIDAGPWIGYSAERLDKQGGKGAIEVEGGHPWVLPNATLASESLERFDAEVRYRAQKVLTPNVPIDNLDLTLSLKDKVIRIKPVALDLAGGRLTSYVSIDARKKTVVTDYDIRLSPVPLGRLLTSFGGEAAGTTGVIRGRIQLRGYGDTVRKSLGSSNGRIVLILPKGKLWLRNAELVELDIGDFVEAALSKKLKEPAQIRCGLIGFTVRNGTAGADPILIDTERSVIRGKGGFTFKDERLDLAFEADAKNPSLFSGQSPVGLKGYFAAPTIDPLSKELVGRAGAGVILGAVATPLAALLAFLDVGEEEDTNCKPVLAGARGAAVKAADKAAEDDEENEKKEDKDKNGGKKDVR